MEDFGHMPEGDPVAMLKQLKKELESVQNKLKDSQLKVKRAEEEKKLSEERYHKLLNNCRIIFFSFDQAGLISYISPSVERITGYAPGEIIGRNISDFVGIDIQKIRQHFTKSSEALSLESEYVVTSKTGVKILFSTTTDALVEKNDLLGGYVTMKEITGHRIGEESTRNSENEYKKLVETINDVVFEINNDDEINYISPSIQKIAGYTANEMLNRSIYDFVFESDKETLKQAISSLQRHHYSYREFRIITKPGSVRWVRSATTKMMNHGQKAGGMGTLIDIHDKKQAELILYAHLLLGDFSLHRSRNELIVQLLELLTKLTRSETGFFMTVDEKNKNITLQGMNRQKEENASLSQASLRYLRIDDTEIWTKCIQRKKPLIMQGKVFAAKEAVVPEKNVVVDGIILVPIFRDEELVGIVGVGNKPMTDGHSDLELILNISEKAWDIIERIDIREERIQGESDMNFAQEITKMGSWSYNYENEVLTWSENNYKLFGIEPYSEEITSEFIFNRIHPEDVAGIRNLMEELKETPKRHDIMFRIMMPDGSFKWVLNYVVPVLKDNVLIGIKGTSIDITGKKRDHERIQEQNDRLRATMLAIPDDIMVIDSQGNYLDYFREWSAETSTQIPSGKLATIHQEFDQELVALHMKHIHQCIATKKSATFEYKANKGKQTTYYEVRIAPLNGEKAIMIQRDITKKKKDDIALKRLILAIEYSPISTVVTDLDANIEYVNTAFQTTTGYNFGELTGRNIGFIKSGKVSKATYNVLWKTIRSGKVWHGELINKRKNGELYYEKTTIAPVFDEQGTMINFVGVKQDITGQMEDGLRIAQLNEILAQDIESRNAQLAAMNADLMHEIGIRKKTEANLLLKSRELENFFDVALDLLCIADLDGRFLKMNLVWESVLGYTINELMEMKFIDLVHPDDVTSSQHMLSQLSKHRPVVNFVNRFRTKNGQYRSIEWSSSAAGNNIFSAARDITERQQAEEILRWNQSLLQLMADSSPLGFLVVDNRTDEIIYFNDRFCDIWNIRQLANNMRDGSMKNRDVIPYCLPVLEDVDAFAASCEPLQDENNRIVISDDIPFKGGRTVHRYSTQIRGMQDEYFGRFYIFEEITARENAKKLLDQSRQNYETFFNAIDEFLIIINNDGQIIEVNDRVIERLGYSHEELMRQTVDMLRPMERRHEVHEMFDDISHCKNVSCNMPLVTKSGEYIPVQTNITKGFWNGKPVYFSLSKDVSDIMLSEQKFAAAFQTNSAMMVISLFNEGTIIDVNEAFIYGIGLDKEEIIGKNEKEIGLILNPPDIRAQVVEKLNHGMAVDRLEVQIKTKSGETKYFLLSANTIVVGQSKCLLKVYVEITERKKVLDEIKRARIEAEFANKAKSEFLSRMSHELRTPMNSILGFAQLLKMGKLEASQLKGVNHILHSGKHLLNLINEVLDISRIESGQISISIEPVRLLQVIQETLDVVAPLAANMKIQIENKFPADSGIHVMADKQRLKQVLINLVNNAIKYNKPNGKVLIDTVLVNNNGSSKARVSVTDTGIGIAENDLDRLFNPFERIGADRTEIEGTGLGLSVVKKLISTMQGHVGVSSVLGEGSTFWIEIPQTENQSAAFKDAEIVSEQTDQRSGKGTVLYIEDNMSNTELVEQIISAHRPGIRLVSNITGKQTVKLAIRHKPELILLDLNLPDIHGSDVLKMLLLEERTKHIPVVVVSADAMPHQLERLITAGARDYLTKPLDVMAFLDIIDEYVGNQHNEKN